MTRDELRDVVLKQLVRLAPEIDPDSLPPRTRLREDLDLDSFDFGKLVTALEALLAIDVPEADYRKLETLGGCLDYLSMKVPGSAPEARPAAP